MTAAEDRDLVGALQILVRIETLPARTSRRNEEALLFPDAKGLAANPDCLCNVADPVVRLTATAAHASSLDPLR